MRRASPKDLTKHSEFRDSLSLMCIAKALAGELLKSDPLEAISKKENGKSPKFCLGVHVRQVFDTGSPTVHVEASDPALADKILLANKGHGNQTLNHVLDSLLGNSFDDEGLDDLAAFVRVKFVSDIPPSCDHPFDCKNEVQKGLADAFTKSLRMFKGRKRTCDSFCHLPTVAAYSPRSQQEDNSPKELVPLDYYCGSTKVCDRLGIPVTPLALSSVWRAIIQLGQYAGQDNFGNETATFVLRGNDPFGFVIGFTIICADAAVLEPGRLASCFQLLCRNHAALNKEKCTLEFAPKRSLKGDCDKGLSRVRLYAGMRMQNDAQEHFVPPVILNSILASVTSDCPAKGKDKRFAFVDGPEGFQSSIQSFIYLASKFCDEKIEGRELCFGLVHGNPYLMFHWDGPSPIPLAVGGEFMQFLDLPRQFHLIEDPEDRCLVLPFLPPTPHPEHPHSKPPEGREVTANGRMPTYALELRHFKEAFTEADEIQLWSEEFRPYSYFTRRHPWAVACVVGPHSEMRVFARGNLVAYRDGKGWKSFGYMRQNGLSVGRRVLDALHPWKIIARENEQWRRRLPLLRRLIELAVQMSPIANRQAKGGLLFYSPQDFPLKTGQAELKQKKFLNLWYDKNRKPLLQDLKPLEPDTLPGEGDLAWLKQRCLLKKNTDDGSGGTWLLDEEIAHRLLRACKQEGGAIVCGEKGLVQGFAKRIIPPATSEGEAGTKRTTVRDYVTWTTESGSLSNDNKGLGLGIAVSADGEITIAYSKGSNSGAWKTKGLILFKILLI